MLISLTFTLKSISTVSRQTFTCVATYSVVAAGCRTTTSVVSITLIDIYIITGQDDIMKYVNCMVVYPVCGSR